MKRKEHSVDDGAGTQSAVVCFLERSKVKRAAEESAGSCRGPILLLYLQWEKQRPTKLSSLIVFSSPPCVSDGISNSPANDNALASGPVTGLFVSGVIIIRIRWTAGWFGISVATSAASTVQLHPVALAGDAVALTTTNWGCRVADRRQRRRRRAARTGGQWGTDWAWRAIRIRVFIRQSRAGKAPCELVHGGSEVTFPDVARCIWLWRLGVQNSGRRERPAMRNVGWVPSGTVGSGGRVITAGNIKNIELPAGGGLDGIVYSGVIWYVIPIHDVLSQKVFWPVLARRIQERKEAPATLT